METIIDKIRDFRCVKLMNGNNLYNFIVNIYRRNENYIPQKGIFFNKQIGCPDDILYERSEQFYGKHNNMIEYKVFGIDKRLKSAMLLAACNPMCAKAKYIIFSANNCGLGYKYGNSTIGVFENIQKDVDPNLHIEYDLFSTYEKR